jgi:hypothetical protein
MPVVLPRTGPLVGAGILALVLSLTIWHSDSPT